MKTNKSLRKRVKVSKNGKTRVQKSGRNHLNMKQSGKQRRQRRKTMGIKIPPKIMSRFLSL